MEGLQILCNQCGTFICKAHSEHHIGIQVQEAGGVYKIPILFNDSPDPLFFCNSTCKDIYYEANIPKNEKVTNALNELKADIPKMAQDTIDAVTKVIDNFKTK